MSSRWICALVVFASLCFCALAPAAYTTAFDATRTELLSRKTALASATDKAGKKQYAAVVKALGKLDALDLSPTPSVAGDIKTAVTVFGALEKAFRTEFPKGLPPTGALGAALSGGADTLRTAVEAGFVALSNRLSVIPAGKLKSSAQKQADIAGTALGKSDDATSPTAIVKLLKTAQTAITKGLATAAKAPVTNVVTATIGSVAYVGENNYLDYHTSASLLALNTNAATAGLGGFASFEFSPFIAPITGPGDYPITGTMRVGADPGNNTQYYISSGTMHLTTFDTATQRATGDFSITVAGHPELSSADGHFDFFELRIQ